MNKVFCTTIPQKPLDYLPWGSIVVLDGGYYILARTGAINSCLVNLATGNRYHEPINSGATYPGMSWLDFDRVTHSATFANLGYREITVGVHAT